MGIRLIKFLKKLKNIIKKTNSNLNLFLSFRKCFVGDQLLENFACRPCKQNFYLFDRTFSWFSDVCKTCENKNFNCYGGFKLTPKANFWRLNEKSINFLACPNPNACIGDLENPDNSNYYHYKVN